MYAYTIYENSVTIKLVQTDKCKHFPAKSSTTVRNVSSIESEKTVSVPHPRLDDIIWLYSE